MVERHVQKAKELFSNKKYKKAIKWCDKSIRQDPHDINAFILKSFALNAIADEDYVFDCFNQGLSLNPDSGSLWIYKGIYEFEMDLLEDALNSFNKSLEIENTSYAFFKKCELLALLDKLDEAWDVVNIMSNKYPDLEEIYYLKALLFYTNYQDIDAALDNIEKFLEFQPNNKEALLLKNDIEDYIIFGY